MTHSFPGYHWIYWVGPALGAGLSAGFFILLELFDWRTANPGQDFDDLETQIIAPHKKTDRPNVAQPALHEVKSISSGSAAAEKAVPTQEV